QASRRKSVIGCRSIRRQTPASLEPWREETAEKIMIKIRIKIKSGGGWQIANGRWQMSSRNKKRQKGQAHSKSFAGSDAEFVIRQSLFAVNRAGRTGPRGL